MRQIWRTQIRRGKGSGTVNAVGNEGALVEQKLNCPIVVIKRSGFTDALDMFCRRFKQSAPEGPVFEHPRYGRTKAGHDFSVLAAQRFVKFAKNVWGLQGEDEEALAEAGIACLEEFFRKAGIPGNLTALGITSEHFRAMAEHANVDNFLSEAFVPLTNDDIVEIYKACL